MDRRWPSLRKWAVPLHGHQRRKGFLYSFYKSPHWKLSRQLFPQILQSTAALSCDMSKAAMRAILVPVLAVLFSACSQTPPPQPPPVEVAAEEIVLEDCVETEEIQRALAARKHGFLSCYADAVALDPMLKGTVTIAFVIPPSGLVEEVNIAQSDLDSDSLHACMTQVAIGMQFTQETCSLPRDIEYSVRLKRGSSEFVSSIE